MLDYVKSTAIDARIRVNNEVVILRAKRDVAALREMCEVAVYEAQHDIVSEQSLFIAFLAINERKFKRSLTMQQCVAAFNHTMSCDARSSMYAAAAARCDVQRRIHRNYYEMLMQYKNQHRTNAKAKLIDFVISKHARIVFAQYRSKLASLYAK